MLPLPKHDEHYTYSDYASWNDGNRCELIDGVVYMMSPAPTREHQAASMAISSQLYNYLKGRQCAVYHAPFDVRLNAAGDRDDTVVQPDIVVVCDKAKLDRKGCNGAPDMVVEILSPSTLSRDRVLKLNKYLQAGVREYWIVDTEGKTVSVHLLEDGRYVINAYGETETIPVKTISGCQIDMREVFADI
ncbi:MAG: Uma2 family endonuclease [Clostridiales bacterium]|nr:Uma2 family endonuclease [Clostridiales bacterium]